MVLFERIKNQSFAGLTSNRIKAAISFHPVKLSYRSLSKYKWSHIWQPSKFAQISLNKICGPLLLLLPEHLKPRHRAREPTTRGRGQRTRLRSRWCYLFRFDRPSYEPYLVITEILLRLYRCSFLFKYFEEFF